VKGSFSRTLYTVVAAVLLGVCGGAATGPRDLAGTWRAEAEHAGATGEIVLRFDQSPSGEWSAILSLPTIDAREIALTFDDAPRADKELFARRGIFEPGPRPAAPNH
jgi:hypothetical protein